MKNHNLDRFKPYLVDVEFSDEKGKERAFGLVILRFPMSFKKILMLSIVQAILTKILIKSVNGIEKSFVIEKKSKNGKEKVIQTQGINFEECYKH
jgi:hypothetical protein